MDKWGDKGKYEGIDVDSCLGIYPFMQRLLKVVIVSVSEVTPEQRKQFKAYPARYATRRNWLP